MPNWCEHDITITGPAKDLDAFWQEIGEAPTIRRWQKPPICGMAFQGHVVIKGGEIIQHESGDYSGHRGG